MAAEDLLELTRLTLLATTLEEAVLPTLTHLVSGTPALGAVYLEPNPDLPLPEQVGERSGKGDLALSSASRPRLSGAQHHARSTFGTPPNRELVGQMVRALAHPYAPLVAASASGQTLSLTLERDPQGHPQAVLGLYTYQPYGLPPEAEERFLNVAETLGPLLTRLYQQQRLERDREQAYRALGLALELRGTDPPGHTQRVADLSVRLGQKLGFLAEDLGALRWGAYLHDLGMLGIPDSILLKRGKLELPEWQILHLHPEDGLRFAESLGELPPITRHVILQHHEHWDGSGYPQRLRGSDIALEARLFAVVDAFDALTTTRPYRAPLETFEALEEIAVRSFGHFDPEVVEAFVSLFEKHNRHAF